MSFLKTAKSYVQYKFSFLYFVDPKASLSSRSKTSGIQYWEAKTPAFPIFTLALGFALWTLFPGITTAWIFGSYLALCFTGLAARTYYRQSKRKRTFVVDKKAGHLDLLTQYNRVIRLLEVDLRESQLDALSLPGSLLAQANLAFNDTIDACIRFKKDLLALDGAPVPQPLEQRGKSLTEAFSSFEGLKETFDALLLETLPPLEPTPLIPEPFLDSSVRLKEQISELSESASFRKLALEDLTKDKNLPLA